MTSSIDSLGSEDQLVKRAIDALLVALGPVETSRFLALKQAGQLDSVAQHRAWQASLDRDELYAEVFAEPHTIKEN
ncbi:MAG: hypothetical protein KDE58_41075 [Caldilineaceae bacterium]|nr:hypothetical protein [Caldilineaceae bacterium]